jgi:hypothetical protein
MKHQTNLFRDVPVHGEERDEFDRYYTPEWPTRLLVEYLGDDLQGCVWEPACGMDWIGRIIRTVNTIWLYVGTDLDPEAESGHWEHYSNEFVRWGIQKSLNFLTVGLDYIRKMFRSGCDWLITNPPYDTDHGSAAQFVERALELQRLGLVKNFAMLLRIGWLEPCDDRKLIFQENPPSEVLVLPRVHYVGGAKQNNQTSAWFIWRSGAPKSTELKVLVEKPRP